MPVDEPLYPVNLRVADRRCLVVGGGRVAADKVAGLLECEALVHVVAPALGELLAELGFISPTTARFFARAKINEQGQIDYQPG